MSQPEDKLTGSRSANPEQETHTSERSFLHALATPLSTLGLMIESLLETPASLSQDQLETLQKAHALSGRVYEMIRNRRSQLLD